MPLKIKKAGLKKSDYLIILLIVIAVFGDYAMKVFIKNFTPDTSGEVSSSFHVSGYENAWILDAEGEEVLIQLVGKKTFIIFRPSPLDFLIIKRKIGRVAGVTFDCNQNLSPDKEYSIESCDLKQPTRIYVGNKEAELVEIIKDPG